MCGISGIVASWPSARIMATVARMTSTLSHRGPDAEGMLVSDGVALGHRRLSIIDPSPTGAQPMRLGEAGPAITYNGETYNFKDLRAALQREGAVFVGTSDTEVVLNAYARWGLEGLRRLEGMFAFGLWDAQRRRLVLMRDRLGIKPLYYVQRGEMLAFGSEIKALHAAFDVSDVIDHQGLAEYLWYGNTFEDRTILSEVRVLQPGHWLIWEDGRSTISSWWTLEKWLAEVPRFQSLSEAAGAVRQAVDSAVSRQLMGDVPVGLFLSGGVDSSIIAASAAHSGVRLRSYSVGFDFDHGIDELPKARIVAAQLGLPHEELRIGSEDIREAVVAMVRAHDEPFADAANIPLYLLARALGGAVKVVLQGDGGDEMFGGYRRYALLRNLALWRAIPRGAVAALAKLPLSSARRIVRLCDALHADEPASRMALLLTMEAQRDGPEQLLGADARLAIRNDCDPFLAFKNAARRFAGHEPVQQMLLTDLTLQLPCQFLTKVDRATMAWGLEARVPLLDEIVGRLAVPLDSRFKVSGTRKKIVLRAAARGRVPDAILNGPKTGFGVPYGHWLRTALADFASDLLLQESFTTRFGMDRKRLEEELRAHRAGYDGRSFLLWKCLQLAIWHAERGT